MKKYFYTFLTTLMAVTTTMALVSCSDDDDNDDSGTASKNSSSLKCPDNHHPHMVDLGLPSGTKWACCNVGADKPEAYGGYYAWGENDEKTVYNEVTYLYCTGEEDIDGDGMYDKNSSYQDLGPDIADTQYDVAHMKWGGSWLMPSLSQFEELLDNSTSTWTTMEGVYGRLFTGRNGGTIFLPAAFYRRNGDFSVTSSFGYYWSSTQYPSYSNCAYFLGFNSDGATRSYYGRLSGLTVRPVINVSTNTNLH